MTAPPILTADECDALGRRILGMVSVSDAQVQIASQATASVAFARGDAHVASETRSNNLSLVVASAGQVAVASTSRRDDPGLAALVREAEALVREHRTPGGEGFLPPQTYPEGPRIYFDSVPDAMSAEAQAELFRRATDATEAAGLIAAGNVHLAAHARSVRNTQGLAGYERGTYGEFSLTARTKDGTGSGWGWSGFEDWSRVDTKGVIARAVDLAQRSAKPVAVEPGRYTVILEPAAVAALVEAILQWWPAQWADQGWTVFSRDPVGSNKIGLQMMDGRLGMVSSPWDPERPASTISPSWTPIPRPVTWFERGILTNLSSDAAYAQRRSRLPVINPGGARLVAEGPPQTLDEMIASTPRGLWVNRLSGVLLMNVRTLLLTGTTRDGTFLIENGKITKAIKNFRFTESPFFVLNRLEAWGEPVRASHGVVAPRLKLRDFDFTSLTDAV